MDLVSIEESLKGSEGWSLKGGIMDTPKVGSTNVSPVRAETSSKDVTPDGWSNWIGATPGAWVGVPTGAVMPW